MDTPGVLLKAARQERGISLEDLARTTRIPRTTLHQLEQDSFDELPAEVFVRGFLRNLARELEIDSFQVVQSYELHTGRAQAAPLEQVEAVQEEAPVLPQMRMIERLHAPKSDQPTRWDRVVNTVGSTNPAYVISGLIVLLGLALAVSISVASSNKANAGLSNTTGWNSLRSADSTKARMRWNPRTKSNPERTAN